MAELVQSSSSPQPGRPSIRQLRLRERRFLLLFFFLLFSILVYPYAESSRFGFYAFRTLGSAIILLTVYAVNFRRNLLVVVLCLAVPALLDRVAVAPKGLGGVDLVNRLLSLAFDVLVLAIIFRRVYSELRPNPETIFGALSVYLLLGFSFASVYGLILSLEPGAFYLDPIANGHALPDRFDFVFYSFGTMTELGTPGMVAVSREVRSVALLEAVLGILYLAVLISRLMSAYRLIPVGVEASQAGRPAHEESGD